MIIKCRSSILVIVSTIMLINCGTVKKEKAENQPVSFYQFFLNKSGLVITVDPYFEKQRQEDNFGADLFSKGLLPVFIVFENKDADDGFIIESEHSKLLFVGYDKQANSPRKKETNMETTMRSNYNSKRKVEIEIQQSADGGTGLGGTAGVLGAPVGGFWGGRALGAALGALLASDDILNLSPMFAEFTSAEIKKILNNIQDKKLVEKVIYQGSFHSGFLYFDLKNKEKDKIKGLLVAVKNIRNGEIIKFMIDLKNKRFQDAM